MSASLSPSVAATDWPMSRTVVSAVPPSVSVKLRDALAPSPNTGGLFTTTPTSAVAVLLYGPLSESPLPVTVRVKVSVLPSVSDPGDGGRRHRARGIGIVGDRHPGRRIRQRPGVGDVGAPRAAAAEGVKHHLSPGGADRRRGRRGHGGGHEVVRAGVVTQL